MPRPPALLPHAACLPAPPWGPQFFPVGLLGSRVLGQGRRKKMCRGPPLPFLRPTLRGRWPARLTRTRCSPRCRQALGPQREPYLSPRCTRAHTLHLFSSVLKPGTVLRSFLNPLLTWHPRSPSLDVLLLPRGASFCRPPPTAPWSRPRLHQTKGSPRRETKTCSPPCDPQAQYLESLCSLASVPSPFWVPCLGWLTFSSLPETL